MMKKVFQILALVLTFALSACIEEKQTTTTLNEINPKEIYFFYQTTCPHCHHAAQYIKEKHPNLKMTGLDVRQPANYNLFLKCAQKFKLNQNSLGTPLICMGDHYIMGWSDIDSKKFDMYVRSFQ